MVYYKNTWKFYLICGFICPTAQPSQLRKITLYHMKFSVLILAIVSIASVQASLLAPKDPFGPLKQSQPTRALISGLEADCAHSELPPVLVELSGLPPKAAVWVQVRRIDPQTSALPTTVESRFYLRKGTEGVLSVPGLHRACRGEGTWTVEVLLSEGRGTTVLASKTFRLGHAPLDRPL